MWHVCVCAEFTNGCSFVPSLVAWWVGCRCVQVLKELMERFVSQLDFMAVVVDPT